jgi:mono/diheme cytochrome c family protein
MAPVQMYKAYCLACHDADGKGNSIRKAMPEAPDFTDPKWQASRSDAELGHSIREGKGKFMLPMKDKLGEADVEQMVAYVRQFRDEKQVVKVEPREVTVPPGPEKPAVVPQPERHEPPRPAEPSAEVAARARVAAVFYRQYCLTCHGNNGKGAEMRAGMPALPDFTNRKWQEERSNPQFVVSSLDGKGTLMPSFRGRVSDEQAKDLAAFVRAFGPPTRAEERPEAADPSGDFDERFRLLQEQWDALQKQLKELQPPARKP